MGKYSVEEINQAIYHYDGDGSKPCCDLVYEALKEMKERVANKSMSLYEVKKYLEDGPRPLYVRIKNTDSLKLSEFSMSSEGIISSVSLVGGKMEVPLKDFVQGFDIYRYRVL